MEKNVLITNYEIAQYSGSEINASTIAKRMKELGYKVYIAALNFDEPLFTDVKEYFDVCINIQKDDFNFEEIEFDLVWAHHFFLLDWLIFEKKLKAKKIIYSSLSGKEYFEAAPIYANDLNLTIANSPETEAQLKIDGITNTYLFENYSFLDYFKRKIKIQKLKNIAIVSNHVPDELYEAKKLLEEKEYNVIIYGIDGKRELITDKILEKYDAIISIGKTVQYAMSLKIPVYIYDRFGGCGYLKMENLEQNRAHNFSGRSFDKKSAEQICNDIINDFDNALSNLEELKKYAFDNFCFETKVDILLETISKGQQIDLDEIRRKYNNISRNLIASKNLLIYSNRVCNIIKEREKDQVAFDYIAVQERIKQEKEAEINNLNTQIKELQNALEQKNKEIAQKDNDLNGIKQSRGIKLISKIKEIKGK